MNKVIFPSALSVSSTSRCSPHGGNWEFGSLNGNYGKQNHENVIFSLGEGDLHDEQVRILSINREEHGGEVIICVAFGRFGERKTVTRARNFFPHFFIEI